MTQSNNGLHRGIQVNQTSANILATLQTIASMDEVAAVAIRCVELLHHQDEEIRTWAAECLSSSVRPETDEEPALLDALETELGSPTRESPGSDSLYWLVTLIGRLNLDDSTRHQRAISLLRQAAAIDDSPTSSKAKRIIDRLN